MTKITIDRAIVEQALEFVTSEGWGTTPYMDVCVYEDAALLREALRAALAEQPQDWDETDALRESLREHMAEIHRLRAELAAHIGGANEMVEPVAWMDIDSEGNRLSVRQWSDGNSQEVPLYAAPAKSKSEGHAYAQVVYQISMKNGATSSAWIDVDEAAYNSAKVYGEYKCRILYTAAPQRTPLTDEEIHDCFQQSGKTKAETRRLITRAIERAHGIERS